MKNKKILLGGIILALILIAAIVIITYPKNKDTSLKCTKDYNPVCGVDGVTYSNACMAGKTEIAYEGECLLEEDYFACTLEEMPVCGIDGVTYANACMAGDTEIAYEGECLLEEGHLPCTLEYMPMCGVDGVTYANACMAGDIEIAYEGECELEDDIRFIICQENTGELDIRETDENKEYVCIFEDNSECEGWKLLNGECNKGEYIFELKNCTREYNPVCGVNGVTYSNPCVAGDIPIEHEGVC